MLETEGGGFIALFVGSEGQKVTRVGYWFFSDYDVITLDFNYVYNPCTKMATVTGRVTGTRGDMPEEVNVSAEVDPATADAFAVWALTTADDENVGK